MKVKYPLDSTLRKQLADTLRYLRKSKQSIRRLKVEVPEADIHTRGFSDLSLQEVLEGISPEDYSSVFIRGGSEEDYDGYNEGYIELYSFRNQTDEEYFDGIRKVYIPAFYNLAPTLDYLQIREYFRSNQFNTKGEYK